MAKQPETCFKEKVLADLKMIPDIWVLKTQEVSVRGIPDVLGCINGKFFALELKVGSKVGMLQQFHLDKIKKCNGIGHVVTPKNWEWILSTLRKN